MELAYMLAGALLFAGGMFTNHFLNRKSPVEPPPVKKQKKPRFDSGNLLDPISPRDQRMEMMLEAASLRGGTVNGEEDY